MDDTRSGFPSVTWILTRRESIWSQDYPPVPTDRQTDKTSDVVGVTDRDLPSIVLTKPMTGSSLYTERS